MVAYNLNMKNLSISLLVPGLLVLLVLPSCYVDKEEELYPPSSGACDTLNTSYVVNVTPILESFCYTCHGDADYMTLGGNIKLEGHANVSAVVSNGTLMSSISHDGGISTPMPKSGNKLVDCNIAIIRQWINEGAQNN